MRQSFNIVGYGCSHLSPLSRLVVASVMICSVDWKLIIYHLLLMLLSFTLNYYISHLEITSGYKSKAAPRNTQARAAVETEIFSLWRACGINSNSHWKVIRNQMDYCGGAFNKKKKNPQPVFKKSCFMCQRLFFWPLPAPGSEGGSSLSCRSQRYLLLELEPLVNPCI